MIVKAMNKCLIFTIKGKELVIMDKEVLEMLADLLQRNVQYEMRYFTAYGKDNFKRDIMIGDPEGEYVTLDFRIFSLPAYQCLTKDLAEKVNQVLQTFYKGSLV